MRTIRGSILVISFVRPESKVTISFKTKQRGQACEKYRRRESHGRIEKLGGRAGPRMSNLVMWWEL